MCARAELFSVQEAAEVFRLGRALYEGNNYLWAEMIACCTRCNDSALAEETFGAWERMRAERGMEGGLLVYEALVAHFTKRKNPERVAQLLEKIRAAHLAPCRCNRNLLLQFRKLFTSLPSLHILNLGVF